MATDKALPSILGSAHNRTAQVARAVAAQSRGVAGLAGATPGWSSPAAKRFQRDLARAGRLLSTQAGTVEALAATIAGAKASAESRIHTEWLAEQAAARRAAEQAAAQRAAQQAATSKGR